MRYVPPTLQGKLDAGVTTLCRCWRIIRTDGITLGFTDHDEEIVFDSITYRAESGLNATAIEASMNLSVDTQSVIGALTSEAITSDDIERGLYDGAEVWAYLVDWDAPEDRVILSRGQIGEIRRSGTTFEAEVLSLSEKLNQPLGRAYIASCPLSLGEPKCGVNLDDPSYRAEGTLLSASGRESLIVGGLSAFRDGWFDNGSLKWLTGANAGVEAVVRRHGVVGAAVTLETLAPLPFEPSLGDRIEVTAGCGKRAEDCRHKFSNFVNFRGFPFLPGDEWVAGYPEEGGAHDGGSLYRS